MTANAHSIESNLHIDLIRLIEEARKLGASFRVTCSIRGRKDQNAAKASGNSRASFGQSAHNYLPALAFDFIPLDENGKFLSKYWNEIKRFEKLSVIFKKAAENIGLNISWGGDWHSFKDYPHIELADWRNIRGIFAP